MAHVTQTTTTTGSVFNPVALVTDAWARFQDWMAVRHTLNALSALSDRELADLGLTRGELFAVAQEAVYGPAAARR